MRNRIFASAALGTLSLFASFSLSANAQNRIPQAISTESERVALSHTVSPKIKHATDLGVAPSDKTLESLSLRFNMSPAQSAALDQLLANQQNPQSPQYHQWLTPEQFAAQFGLNPTDIASVSTWLQAQGFAVTGVARSRTFISFSGSVAQVNQAFGVQLHSVSLEGEQHIANLTDPVLPAAIANVTQAVTGLNDFRVKPHIIHRVVPASATAKFNGGTGTNGYGNLIAPGDFYTIYDINPLLGASTPINGSGIKIAVIGQVDVTASDISSFRTAAGLSSNLPTTVVEGSDPGAPTAFACNSGNPPNSCADVEESSLDLEWAGAVAPSANIQFVTGDDVFVNSMTQAVDQNLAPILTVSYGDCEANFTDGSLTLDSLNALFKQANVQGQTVLGPAGDQGATDCDGDDNPAQTLASNGLSVDYPASSPYVTAVGGTQFVDAGGAYWNSTNGANGGTAISYIPEQAWNEFYQSYNGVVQGLYDGAGGGGVSSYFSKPSWQTGNGVPADASRDVPDVAFNAAANHDGYLVCVFDSCTNGTFGSTSGGVVYYNVFGGTSVSTPSFAGILGLLEQKVSPSKGLGNVNPGIYGLAASSYVSSVFHEKTSGGNNAAPCTSGSPDCSPGYPNYYAAGTIACPANSCTGDIAYPAIGYLGGSGYVYDLATGWGSVDVNNFVTDWPLSTPTAVTTTAGNASTVTASANPASVAAGGSVVITASVASGASGVTTTPTGTVTLLVDNVSTGLTATLANGTATFAAYATPSTIASGTHIFAVSYSGDATYAGSIGSVAVDVTSASAADFSFGPATTTVTLASGATSSGITYTVTSLNGFSGQVSFSAATNSTTLYDDGNIAFSVDTVNVTPTAAGTTVATVYAYYNPNTGLDGTSAFARKGRTGSAKNQPLNPWKIAGSGIALAGVALFGLPRRRRNRWSALLVAIVSVGILAAAGCSQNGSPTSEGGTVNLPAGTYTATLTATGTNAAGTVLNHNVTITIVVQ